MFRRLAPVLLALAAAGQGGVALAGPAEVDTHYYPQVPGAGSIVDAALVEARRSGKIATIVFGADWCHDSRSLAEFLNSETFRSEFGSRYSVTFIDVGVPQKGMGQNMDLVARFGLGDLKSTPAMVVIGPDGKRLNSRKDAIGWRNADSREEEDILRWFRKKAR